MLTFQQLFDIQQALTMNQKLAPKAISQRSSHLQLHARPPWALSADRQIQAELLKAGAEDGLKRPLAASTVSSILKNAGAQRGRLRIDNLDFQRALSPQQLGLRDRVDSAFYQATIQHETAYYGFTDYERPSEYRKIAARQDFPRQFVPTRSARFKALYISDMANITSDLSVFKPAVFRALQLAEGFALPVCSSDSGCLGDQEDIQASCGFQDDVNGAKDSGDQSAGFGPSSDYQAFNDLQQRFCADDCDGDKGFKKCQKASASSQSKVARTQEDSAAAAEVRNSAQEKPGSAEKQSFCAQSRNRTQMQVPRCFSFEFFSCFAAQLCLLYDDAAVVAEVFFGLYYYCFSQLHDVQALARLVASTRELLWSVQPEVLVYLENKQVDVEDIIVPWFLSGFTAVLSPREAFYLWDNALQAKSVSIFALAAAAVLSTKSETLRCFGDAKDIRIYLQECQDLQIMPAIAYIFASSLPQITTTTARRKAPQIERFNNIQSGPAAENCLKGAK